MSCLYGIFDHSMHIWFFMKICKIGQFSGKPETIRLGKGFFRCLPLFKSVKYVLYLYTAKMRDVLWNTLPKDQRARILHPKAQDIARGQSLGPSVKINTFLIIIRECLPLSLRTIFLYYFHHHWSKSIPHVIFPTAAVCLKVLFSNFQ